MRVPVKLIADLVNFRLPSVSDLTDSIGSKLGEVDNVIDLAQKYQDAVIVKVIECHKIDQSDHLNLCLVDDNHFFSNVDRTTSGFIQVVCGASNVKPGLLTVWLPPNTIVPNTFEGKQFKLSSKVLMNNMSHGMLASLKELDISDNHDGIIELSNDHQPGDKFAEKYGLNDQVIVIENKMFTHRPDCFGVLGVAREVSGILNQPFISPDWYKNTDHLLETETTNPDLVIDNQIPDLVPVFKAIIIDNVTIKPSPLWLQIELQKLGVRPISNVVDITNYIMFLTGQPLHAYDYNKLKQKSKNDIAELIVRKSVSNEALTLLNGKVLKLDDEAIVIATSNGIAGLGGVMGGLETIVDQTTTKIVLEAATFDMYSIRKTSMKYGLFSDAVTRYTKGQSPFQIDFVLSYATKMIHDIISGCNFNKIISAKSKDLSSNSDIDLSTEDINRLLGSQLSTDDVGRILSNVEFEVEFKNDILKIRSPYWRTDICLKEDIIEEVGRLYGYDLIDKKSLVRSIKPINKNQEFEINNQIRSFMVARGASELLNYSFVSQKLISNFKQNIADAYRVTNATSPDFEYYRLGLTASLLDKVHSNIKLGFDRFVIYELGRIHSKKLGLNNSAGDVPNYSRRFSMVYAMNDKISKGIVGSSYFWAKKYLDDLFKLYNLKVEYRDITSANLIFKDDIKAYDSGRSASIYLYGQCYGLIGEYEGSVEKAFKLPKFAVGFELDMAIFNNHELISDYRAISKFPAIYRDLCFNIDCSTSYSELFNELRSCIDHNINQTTDYSLVPLDIFSKNLNGQKHVTFRLQISDQQQTLNDQLVNQIVDQISADILSNIGAQLI